MKTYTILSPQMVEQTRERLLAGETCLHHTGHMPGIGGAAFDPDVQKRIAAHKGRDAGKGSIVLVPDADCLADLGVELTPRVRALLEQYWPGNLSVALPCNDPDLQHLAIDGCVAFRAPTGVELRRWLGELGTPITSTSVNHADKPPIVDLDDMPDTMDDWFDFAVLFELEYMEAPQPSTLVRIVDDQLTVLREGSIPIAEIEASWDAPLVLFVCTGNICRSPMAEYYAKRHFKSLGLNVRVESAGFLRSGVEASSQGLQVLGEHGLDGGAHRSRQLTPEMIRSAWRIYTMELRHRDGIVDLAPNAEGKTFVLGEAAGMPGDVADPYMMPVGEYRITYNLLKERIDAIGAVLELDLK